MTDRFDWTGRTRPAPDFEQARRNIAQIDIRVKEKKLEAELALRRADLARAYERLEKAALAAQTPGMLAWLNGLPAKKCAAEKAKIVNDFIYREVPMNDPYYERGRQVLETETALGRLKKAAPRLPSR